MTGVLHQMPAIGDLRRQWERLGSRKRITAATISCDNGNLRLTSEPRLGGRRLPVGQKADRPASFEIANDRALTLVALPRPFVDSDDGRREECWTATAANGSQQGVITHWKH